MGWKGGGGAFGMFSGTIWLKNSGVNLLVLVREGVPYAYSRVIDGMHIPYWVDADD